MNIFRSERFKEELKIILSYIAKDKKSAALKFSKQLQTTIENLSTSPYKGRLSKNGSRELIFKGYTIPYILDNETIVIIGIFNMNNWQL